MEKAFQIAVEREVRRNGTSLVTDKDEVLGLLSKPTSGFTPSSFVRDELIEISKDKAKLVKGSIRGGSEQIRLLVHTNKGVKTLYLSSYRKQRIPVKENNGVPAIVDVDNPINNYNDEVAMFYESCPSQLVFLAAMINHKTKCVNSDTFKAAGFDAHGGPNGTGGTDMDASHATNATICHFKFEGKKPEILEEWLGDDGPEKAAEYIINNLGTPVTESAAE